MYHVTIIMMIDDDFKVMMMTMIEFHGFSLILCA